MKQSQKTEQKQNIKKTETKQQPGVESEHAGGQTGLPVHANAQALITPDSTLIELFVKRKGTYQDASASVVQIAQSAVAQVMRHSPRFMAHPYQCRPQVDHFISLHNAARKLLLPGKRGEEEGKCIARTNYLKLTKTGKVPLTTWIQVLCIPKLYCRHNHMERLRDVITMTLLWSILHATSPPGEDSEVLC